jgi:hypothetical protein
MDAPENPSADKFGPPSGQERFEAPKPRRGPQWFALAATLALIWGKIALEHTRSAGWMVPVLLAGVFLAEVLVKRRRSARNAADPYTAEPNVPR